MQYPYNWIGIYLLSTSDEHIMASIFPLYVFSTPQIYTLPLQNFRKLLPSPKITCVHDHTYEHWRCEICFSYCAKLVRRTFEMANCLVLIFIYFCGLTCQNSHIVINTFDYTDCVLTYGRKWKKADTQYFQHFQHSIFLINKCSVIIEVNISDFTENCCL